MLLKLIITLPFVKHEFQHLDTVDSMGKLVNQRLYDTIEKYLINSYSTHMSDKAERYGHEMMTKYCAMGDGEGINLARTLWCMWLFVFVCLQDKNNNLKEFLKKKYNDVNQNNAIYAKVLIPIHKILFFGGW